MEIMEPQKDINYQDTRTLFKGKNKDGSGVAYPDEMFC